MVLKRPAAMKTKQWTSVPHVRDKKSKYTGQRNDRPKWQRTLWDLTPKNDKALVNLLRKDGLLPKWEGKTCPRCGTGKLSALQPGKTLSKNLRDVKKQWVEEKEKKIIFGTAHAWKDVEADETTSDKKDWGNEAVNRAEPVEWEQWCGIVERGRPESLLLRRLRPEPSEKRAPGPGAIRKVEWESLASKRLKDRQVILHTDAAKSYKAQVRGMLHGKVIHGKKRVKVRANSNGKRLLMFGLSSTPAPRRGRLLW
eukprot:s234_g20.t1